MRGAFACKAGCNVTESMPLVHSADHEFFKDTAQFCKEYEHIDELIWAEYIA